MEEGQRHAEGSDMATEGSRRRPNSVKRKAAGSGSSGPSKRSAKDHKAPLAALHNGPCTRARQSPNKMPVPLPKASESLLIPPKNEVAMVGKEGLLVIGEAKVEEEEMPESESPVDMEFEVIRSRNLNAHVVPTPSGKHVAFWMP
ncbi:hypothetical protein AMTR_s00059p00074030 [Amborella trichopoda]|uniref:Uncharacterized protein n=1 Tax=Amborella trichopoda TaxID=13333 RepID=U5DAS3_AMBTC|nr:hypothetical protein AMTR_s00059p00074030 [Amborella trichopoda]